VVKYAFLCGGSALAVAASLCASPALAATASAADSASSTAETPSVIGELVVVAQKREENIESVPVAISAFSAKQRDVIGLKTTQDLSDFTPGLSYYSIGDQAYIRGIGRNTVNLATASGVATYYNGIYYGANATIAEQKDSLFIGNVEVDNGPQNSLHGSNADGGVISYTSQKPTNSFYAEGRAGLANYGYYYGEAVVSGPITDNVKFRLGGNYSNQSGGFYDNFDGRKEGGFGPQANGGDWGYAEGQLEATFGKLDIWAIASTGDYNTNFHATSTVGSIPTFAFPSGNLEPSSYFGLCSFGTANAAQCGSPANLGQAVVPGSAKGNVTANVFPGNNPSNANPYDFISTTNDFNHQSNDASFATSFTYHFPTMDLVYLVGFQSFDYNLHFNQIFDSGVTSYGIQGPAALGPSSVLTINDGGEFTHFQEQDQYFSNEVNLLSTDKGPLQWVVGAYQYHEHFNQPIDLQCYPNQTQFQAPANGPKNPSSCAIQTDGDITYDDYAGFGHASYNITDQWSFAGSVRYTYDHKEGFEQQRIIEFDDTGIVGPGFSANTLGAFTPAIDITAGANAAVLGKTEPGTGVATINPATGFIVRPLAGSWSAVTGDATLNFKPDSDTLAYLRYARGYKSGGFNAGALAATPETQSEAVDDFELGLKKTWGSTLLLNSTLYYYNWYNDQQPLTVTQAAGNLQNEVFNIPVSHIYGIEMLAEWRPIDPLELTLEYDYLHANISSMNGVCVEDAADPAGALPDTNSSGCKQTTPGVTLQNLTGRQLPQSPPNKVTLNGQYTFKFDPGSLTLSATYVWKDASFDSVFDEPLSRAPSYSQVNLRAYWEDAKDRYTAIFFIDNVLNQLAYNDATNTLVSPAGSPEQFVSVRGLVQPFTIGGEIQVRFR
jgi:iron complex outermembrane receptor protein